MLRAIQLQCAGPSRAWLAMDAKAARPTLTAPRAFLSSGSGGDRWTEASQKLGLAREATADEVKKAFRKLAIQYHPDKPTGDEKKFKEYLQAMELLLARLSKLGPGRFGEGAVEAASIFGKPRKKKVSREEKMDLQREVEEMLKNIERETKATAAQAGAKKRHIPRMKRVVGETRTTVEKPDGTKVARVEQRFSDGSIFITENGLPVDGFDFGATF